MSARYPQIRATSGYSDPRVRATGPGGEPEADRSAMLSARLTIVLSIVVGQLWALTIGVESWMDGHTGAAWWLAGFQVLSALVALVVWRAGDRRDR
jgi:hypothetical protein